MKSLEDAVVQGKRVIVRLDLNVPLSDDNPPKIADDFRLRVILPTLRFLLERDAKVVLVSHLGRPKGQIEAKLSLKPVYQELAILLNRSIKFAPNLFGAATKQAVDELKPGELLGLENLRFDPGEETNSRTFARKLSEYGDIYVNDAFAVSHREAGSLCAITEFLPSYAGLLLEKEVKMLGSLLHHPASPFVAILGGAKIAEKLPLLEHLLKKADRILIGGGIANTFLAAAGEDVKDSLVEAEAYPAAREILKAAQGKIILPGDFVWSEQKILDIGSKTISLYQNYLRGAQTIFWNGNLGYSEDPRFAVGSDTIAKYVADLPATTVVGGGNTAEVISRLGLLNKISFVSSGGGATLEFLSGQKLPGLLALG